MDDILARIFENLGARVTGPMKFRLLMQPLMACVFAVKSGLMDARAGKPAYFWGLFTAGARRAAMLRDGWKSVGKVFVLAMLLDVVYQVIVERFVYPGEVVIVAVLLAIVPYLLVRGPVNRLARHK